MTLKDLQTQNGMALDSAVPSTPPISTVHQTIYEDQVQFYQYWLRTEQKRHEINNSPQELERYRQEAMQPVRIAREQALTFAPYRREYSADRTFTRGQILAFLCMILLFAGGLYLWRLQMIVIALGIIIFAYLFDVLVYFVLALRTLDASAEIRIDDALVHALAEVNWPRYMILCPLYHETAVVPQFVRAMQALDYPKDRLQILFLTEEDDRETREAIAALNLPPHFSIITVPEGKPQTKPRACNYGLLKATGDYVVIYDAEDVPEALQLKKAVLAFGQLPANTACIQAKLNFYNPGQNLLTRWFTAEYSLWFDLILPGLQRLKVPLPLGGTSNHFRTHLLRRMGAWDPFNVTEDCDLGLRMSFYGYKTAVLDSTTYEEANSNFKNWIRQRSRWVKGYMQTYLVYMRHPLVYLKPNRWLDFLSIQIFIGGKTLALFTNPLMWALMIIYFAFHSQVEGLYHELFPPVLLYMGMTCMIFGNFFYIYTYLIGCIKRGQYHLVKWTISIPLYWAIASLAAFKAFSQLLFRPFYWEKTIHGLHLSSANSLATITTVAKIADEDTDSLPAQTSPAPSTATNSQFVHDHQS